MSCRRMLSVEDCAAIMVGLEAGLSQVCIARSIGRSPSVVCREIARHRGPGGVYQAQDAGRAAQAARRRPKKRLLDRDEVLRRRVISDLSQGRTPRQISGRLSEASLISDTEKETEEQSMTEHYTTNTKIEDVINDPVFGDYGRLIFPVDSGYYGGSTLGNLSLTWYNYIDSDKTVEICNYMRNQAENGDTIFYDIYTEEEKAADPAKRDTGLFFFKGNPGTKFAIVNAGGGFAYVGAMHDSFPHALELSKMGYNAFALIYRPGAQTACEDLSRAIDFISRHTDELQVDTDGYSLWGGSAGGRMADWVGTYGTEYFGEKAYPHPAAVIVNYTGLSEVTGYEPPTYSAVGTSDGIASWRTMKSRLDTMSEMDIPTEFHSYDGLPHGFGLGTGTVAEGWIDDAVAFWEDQM